MSPVKPSQKYLEQLHKRYTKAKKKERSKILNEVTR